MSLRSRLRAPEILIAPGVFDGLTSIIAAKSRFEALYLSGAAVSYTRLGRPDIGLTSVTEMTETMALIRDCVDLPVIVDADTGFGNALNAQRTMRLYERAGASALQVEDQTFPKRCGHLSDKLLISVGEMVGKISAMADVRSNDETLIIARTDAISVEGFEAALERANAYVEAGADVLFIEAPRSGAELRDVPKYFDGRVPLLVNMVEGGATPLHDAADLEKIGYSIVIFPGGIVRALVKTAVGYYASLKAYGSNRPFAKHMFDFDGLNDYIGTSEMLKLGRCYEDKK